MTRDEARAKVAAATKADPKAALDYPMIDFFIDAALALGLFVVADPETAEDRAWRAISNISISEGFGGPRIKLTRHIADSLFRKMEKAGLKIVDANPEKL
jgi:hypothetical protein